MGIKMNMFAGNQMTAANDGMIYDKMLASSGILQGCEMTFMGANQIHIAKGYLIIKGRLCTVLEETILVEMSSTDVELPGRLYVHADLADTNEPVKITSVVSNPLPALVQDSAFNFDNGIYEIELGTYTAGRVAIKNFKQTCGTIEDMGGTKKEIDKINGNITSLTERITSFENTKAEIVSSSLGQALSLTLSHTWAQIVAKIKAVVNRGKLDWSSSNTTYTLQPGYYPGGTLDSRPSYTAGYNAGVAAGKATAASIQVRDNKNVAYISSGTQSISFTIPANIVAYCLVFCDYRTGYTALTESLSSGNFTKNDMQNLQVNVTGGHTYINRLYTISTGSNSATFTLTATGAITGMLMY